MVPENLDPGGNAYKLLVGGYLLVFAAYLFSQVLDSS